MHLIKHAIKRTAEKGGAFVLLGSGPGGVNGEFEELAAQFKDNPLIQLQIMYSEVRSRCGKHLRSGQFFRTLLRKI